MKDDVESKPTTGRLFLTVFPSIMLPMFLAVVDQTIVATALPAIAASLGSVGRISWVVISYLVAATIAAPVYGQLRDVFGGRRMMLIALSVFIAASLLCTVATSVEMLALARVLQGFGGGGLMTLSQALIGETIPPRERGRYQGYLAAVIVTSSTFGPVVGGYLTYHFGWRSIFLVNLPLGLVAVLMTLRLVQRQGNPQSWTFDKLGLFFFVGFIAPLLLALEQVQRWNSGAGTRFLILITIALTSLALLIRQERRASYPLLPIHLLRQPTIWRSDALAACHGGVLVSLVTFLPLYLHVSQSASSAETGLLLLPLMLGLGTGSMTTGRIVSRTGYTTIFPSIGLMGATVGLVVLSVWAANFSHPQLSVLLFLSGLCMGTVMGVVQVTVQSAADKATLGSAAASVQLSRSVGAAVGTALVGTILFAVVAHSQPETARLFASMIERGADTMASVPSARQEIVRGEIAVAFRAAFLTMAGFAAIGATIAWSIPTRRLS
ncbi:MFS transporter [Hyphomicrobium sp.]|uniref:MFS transporter n=1 Tax=Hyphomicrobium sp. TaxID=82 RepID=UPI001329B6CC|nr:MFS transporter [Hyphomicrobium sp.]KAB2937244.1 MAG: MFS transporter [Hyphomicrobium sp.]